METLTFSPIRRYGAIRERLTSARDTDGSWHAHYPTAHRTLCGLLLSETAKIGRRYAPTCEKCFAAALAMDRIDGSVPNYWRPE